MERLGDSLSSFSTGSLNGSAHGPSNVSSGANVVGGQNMVMLPEGFEPGEYDVICGRGRKSFHHLGNSCFRDLVARCLERYANATKVEKSFVLSDVVNQVRQLSPNGGFVKKDQSSGRWHEVGDFLAREKTSQAFRDALHDLYKSSNTSKKKRRHAERTGRQVSQYQREPSNSSLCTDDLQTSDHSSLGYNTSCTTTTSGGSFLGGVSALTPNVVPSSLIGMTSMIGSLGTGPHGSPNEMEIAFNSRGYPRSNSFKSIGSAVRSLQLQQQQLSELQLQWSRRSCPNIKLSSGVGDGNVKFSLESHVEELDGTQGPVPLPAVSMSSLEKQRLISDGKKSGSKRKNDGGSNSLLTADVGGSLQLATSSTMAATSLSAREQQSSLSKPHDHLLRAHSQPNLVARKFKPQHTVDMVVDDGDHDMDDADDSGNKKNTKIPKGGDMLFDRLIHFADCSGKDGGNPFEPEPIPETV